MNGERTDKILLTGDLQTDSNNPGLMAGLTMHDDQ